MRQVARILFDSAQMTAAVDARSIQCEERSLLFASGALSVDMVIYASEDGLFVVHGQVIDAEVECPLSGATVRIDGAEDAVETDEFGQFAVSGLGSPDGESVQIDTGTLDLTCVVPCSQPTAGSR